MKLVGTIQNHWHTIKEGIKNDPLQILSILVLSLSLLWREDIPAYSITFATLLSISYFIYNIRNHTKKYLWTALAIAVGSLLEYTYLFTWHTSLLHSATMLITLALLLMMVWYYTNKYDVLQEAVNRLHRTGISIGYFITMYIIIYVIAFFSNTIFDLHIDYFGRLFNYAVAVSTFCATLILFTYDKTPASSLNDALSVKEATQGYFFTLLFGKIVPKLSLLTAVLAIIYMIQLLLGYRPDIMLGTVYYPYVVMFYGTFLLGVLCNPTGKEQRYLIYLFIILTLVVLTITITRQIHISSQRYSAIYSELINLIFIAYNIHLLRSGLRVTPILSYCTGIVLLIIFCPLIGYVGYTSFATFPEGNLKQVPHYSISSILDYRESGNMYDQHKLFMHTMYRPPEETERVNFSKPALSENYPLYNYSKIYLNERLSNSSPITAGTVTLEFSQDNKVVTISEPNKPSATVNIYDEAKKMNALPYGEQHPIIYQDTDYLLIITEYHWRPSSETLPSHGEVSFTLTY